jgi:hypothetical protein
MRDWTTTPGSRLYQVPARPDHLRGREKELDKLDELLAPDRATAAITPAVTGQGGIGKTQPAGSQPSVGPFNRLNQC